MSCVFYELALNRGGVMKINICGGKSRAARAGWQKQGGKSRAAKTGRQKQDGKNRAARAEPLPYGWADFVGWCQSESSRPSPTILY